MLYLVNVQDFLGLSSKCENWVKWYHGDAHGNQKVSASNHSVSIWCELYIRSKFTWHFIWKNFTTQVRTNTFLIYIKSWFPHTTGVAMLHYNFIASYMFFPIEIVNSVRGSITLLISFMYLQIDILIEAKEAFREYKICELMNVS